MLLYEKRIQKVNMLPNEEVLINKKKLELLQLDVLKMDLLHFNIILFSFEISLSHIDYVNCFPLTLKYTSGIFIHIA